MYTTLLDILVKARVLHDDNAKWNNGMHVLYPMVLMVGGDEWVEISIEELPIRA
jgi:hypothetical protein